MIPLVWQLSSPLISTITPVAVAFIILTSKTKQHIGHPRPFLLHRCIPFNNLLSLRGAGLGILALISWLPKFLPTLYAMRGGAGKTSRKYGSVLTIVLQCFVTILETDGILGSYRTTNTGRGFPTSFLTSFRASWRGTARAFLIHSFTMFNL